LFALVRHSFHRNLIIAVVTGFILLAKVHINREKGRWVSRFRTECEVDFLPARGIERIVLLVVELDFCGVACLFYRSAVVQDSPDAAHHGDVHVEVIVVERVGEGGLVSRDGIVALLVVLKEATSRAETRPILQIHIWLQHLHRLAIFPAKVVLIRAAKVSHRRRPYLVRTDGKIGPIDFIRTRAFLIYVFHLPVAAESLTSVVFAGAGDVAVVDALRTLIEG
jgi:hypothetical protein